ncbi:MAG: hypothetical protein HYR51_17090 [Candidatus Rokubacteria bacterium]|nr:hypothetical protein [Candidatus Rokubacteria bacterium]
MSRGRADAPEGRADAPEGRADAPEGEAMAHLPALAPDQIADPELAALARASGDEMFGVYGHAPEAFRAFLAFC